MAKPGGELDRMIRGDDGLTPDQSAAEQRRADENSAALSRLSAKDDAHEAAWIKLKALREAQERAG